jgi:hypothetical protein
MIFLKNKKIIPRIFYKSSIHLRGHHWFIIMCFDPYFILFVLEILDYFVSYFKSFVIIHLNYGVSFFIFVYMFYAYLKFLLYISKLVV